MHDLPLQVGQLAECRSFLVGYRGAWFRCKIKGITQKKGQIMHAIECIDFPDEKIVWTKVYQKRRLLATSGKAKVTKELMVRPSFPPVYHASKMPDINTTSEAVVVIEGEWKVGDYVDWWTDDCYWSGRIMEILGDEKFKLDLLPPPAGEGSSYEVYSKDLRPSLSWSPEHGWMLPNYVDSKNGHARIRINNPLNSGAEKLSRDVKLQEKSVLGIEGSQGCCASFASQISGNFTTRASESEQTSSETNVKFDLAESRIEKSSCCGSVSSSHFRDASTEMVGAPATNEVRRVEMVPSKKKVDESINLNSSYSDTIEAAILDLEELVHKVKWIRGILKFGTRYPSTIKPSWQYTPHRGSSTPK